jgi:pimeloyl-ACP methyl ester carboxylesterase
MSKKYYEIKETFRRIERVPTILRQPVEKSDRSDIAVVFMHSDSDYLDLLPAIQLAKCGYTTLATITPDGTMDRKLSALAGCVKAMRELEGINKVVIFGHSGGATLNSAYAAIAENGLKIFQTPDMLYKMPDIGELPPVDGFLVVDSNWGNGTMTLMSIDPCITDETNGRNLDLSYNIYDPANGYSPDGSHYSDEFVKRFLKAQGDRMNRIVNAAVERLHAIESGKGMYNDDEPFIIPGGAQMAPNNKLFPQDIRFLSHTKNEHTLVHDGGVTTTEIVHSLRRPNPGRLNCDTYRSTAQTRTVKTFLSNASLLTDGFGYDETSVYGIDFSRSYSNTLGNITYVHCPVLFVGLSGGYESMATEQIYDLCPSEDKSIAYIEGATHVFTPNTSVEAFPGQFGDPNKTLCDYLDGWLFSERFGK